MSIASITLVIVGYLVLASLVQPAAERLHLPYAVSSFGAKNARGSADPSPKVMFARDSALEG